jgi:hypothetical protein
MARHDTTQLRRIARREKRDAHATPITRDDDDAHFARMRVRILLTHILRVQIA